MYQPTASARTRTALNAGRSARARAFGDTLTALFGRGGPRGDHH